jgi:predicted transglutaminase-like cysteine proteinase
MALTRYKQFILLVLLSTSQLTAQSSIKFSETLFAKVSKRYNKDAETRVRNWQTLINETKSLTLDEQLYRVNRFFNRVSFKDDLPLWGKSDYWATPIEFLGVNAGDCEDFTIAKYVTLLALGVPDESLRLMYVTATRPRQAHMVLAYYPTQNAVPLVLDNINKRILPATRRNDLIPIYSFNGEGLWLAKEQGRGRQMQSSNNNKLWTDLQKRMLKDN